MARYKVTIFVSSGKAGSSQSWITRDVSPSNLVSAVNRLLEAYTKLWNVDVKFEGVRIGVAPNDPNTPTITRSKPYYPGVSVFPGADKNLFVPATGQYSSTHYMDNPKMCQQVAVYAGTGNNGQRYFSPIPDELWADGQDQSRTGKSPTWDSGLKQVLGVLWTQGQGGEEFAIKNRADAGSVEMQQYIYGLALQGGAGSNLGVILQGDSQLTFPANSRVQIKHARAKKGSGGISINGMYTVDASTFSTDTGSTTVFLRNTPNLDPSLYKKLGTLQKVVYQYASILDMTAVRCTEHKRGVPFGSPVGRSQTRVTADP